MKNKDIITLVQGGLLAASAHSLPVEHFYKFHKFRRAISRAYDEIGREQRELMREIGVTQQQVADSRNQEPAVEAFRKANDELLAEPAEVKLPARIPYEFYRGIYDENRTQCGDIFASFPIEDLVLDNLFTEPDEDTGEGDDDE